MTKDDQKEFLQRLVVLGEYFDRELSASLQAAYYDALKIYPREEVFAALSAAMAGSRFFPKIAEIVDWIEGAPEDVAEAAWTDAKTAARRVGGYVSVVLDEALGKSIVALFGGWAEFCAAEFSPEMWASKRKEFGRVYSVMRGRCPERLVRLAGECEKNNGQRAEWEQYTSVYVLPTCRELTHDEAKRLVEGSNDRLSTRQNDRRSLSPARLDEGRGRDTGRVRPGAREDPSCGVAPEQR
jgi:hypothetical protein